MRPYARFHSPHRTPLDLTPVQSRRGASALCGGIIQHREAGLLPSPEERGTRARIKESSRVLDAPSRPCLAFVGQNAAAVGRHRSVASTRSPSSEPFGIGKSTVTSNPGRFMAFVECVILPW